MTALTGVVLAGGHSKRMGCDKLHIRLHSHGGTSFLESAVNILKPYCQNIIVSCRQDQSLDPCLAKYVCVYDAIDGAGPIAGICAALSHAQQAILAISCDMPFLDHPTLDTLVQQHNERPLTAVMTTYRQNGTQHVQALTAIYEYTCLSWLEKALYKGKYKINEAIPETLRHDILWTGDEYMPFFNINSLQDLERARQIALLPPFEKQ